MGLFDDILKGLPANAVLREQITQLNAQKAATETENAILKDDLRHAKVEIAKLKKQIEEHEYSDPDFDDVETRILSALGDSDSENERIASWFIFILNLHPERFNYAIERLIARDFVHKHADASYSLAQKGRGYLVRNNLL